MTSARTFILRRCGIWLFAACLLNAATQLATAQQPPKNFVMHEAPRRIATIAFADGQGQSRSLSDFRGKVVVLNIWATWCGPCRREMPALDRLQTALGGSEFEVVALSIDRAGIEAVRKFYTEIGIQHLSMYIDSAGKAPRELTAVGIPTTLLIDREGRELGRLAGPAEWDTSEVIEYFKRVISREHASTGVKFEPATAASTKGSASSAKHNAPPRK